MAKQTKLKRKKVSLAGNRKGKGKGRKIPQAIIKAKSPTPLDIIESEDDPIDGLDTSGLDIDEGMKKEVSAVLQGFKDRNKRDRARFDLAVDSEYHATLVFQSREQKEIFLAAMGWLEYGDKYLNGLILAALQGVELPQVDLVNKKAKPSKRFKGLARPIKTE